MTLHFEVRPAAKCAKKDVITAIGIYSSTVDSGSRTDTNQIKNYIWNGQNNHNDKRDLLFYLFYGSDDSVEGFAEFAFLHASRVLILDYLCTRKRNHMLFYNFYHMVLQEIENDLKKRGLFIEYIVTELSLTRVEGKLVDRDSNYFRHLFSNEHFKLLKYPYYQPPLQLEGEAEEYNLAIKRYTTDLDDSLLLKKAEYMLIVKDIYNAHYLEWFSGLGSGEKYRQIINKLLVRIESEFPTSSSPEPIAFIQCKLLDEGQCPKFEIENYTILAERKHHCRKFAVISIWLLLSITTAFVCVFPIFAEWSAKLCSFLTIISGLISIITFRNDIFKR